MSLIVTLLSLTAPSSAGHSPDEAPPMAFGGTIKSKAI
jgi:hypothetical protein